MRPCGHLVRAPVTTRRTHLSNAVDARADCFDLVGLLQMLILDPETEAFQPPNELGRTVDSSYEPRTLFGSQRERFDLVRSKEEIAPVIGHVAPGHLWFLTDR